MSCKAELEALQTQRGSSTSTIIKQVDDVYNAITKLDKNFKSKEK